MWSPQAPLSRWAVHTHICTHTTHSPCLRAHEQPRQSPKNLHHSQAVVAFHFTAPQAPSAGTHSDAQAVVNRSLPAFHSCSKSIGLCRTQHLIEAHKVTDYWIGGFCIELVCIPVANAPLPHKSNMPLTALLLLSLLLFIVFSLENLSEKQLSIHELHTCDWHLINRCLSLPV